MLPEYLASKSDGRALSLQLLGLVVVAPPSALSRSVKPSPRGSCRITHFPPIFFKTALGILYSAHTVGSYFVCHVRLLRLNTSTMPPLRQLVGFSISARLLPPTTNIWSGYGIEHLCLARPCS